MWKKKVIYFGYSVGLFGSILEGRLLDYVRSACMDCDIEFPNQPEHIKGYANRGMKYYTEEILSHCDEGIFLAYPDGKWGAGVFKEMETLAKAGKKVHRLYKKHGFWHLAPVKISEAKKNLLNIDETRARNADMCMFNY